MAGSPSVILGKDGEVYRGSGAMEPSRVTSRCAKLAWRQNTRQCHCCCGQRGQHTLKDKRRQCRGLRNAGWDCEWTHTAGGGRPVSEQPQALNSMHDPANSHFYSSCLFIVKLQKKPRIKCFTTYP